MPKTSSAPRVFVSSTIRDLYDLRSALKYWLQEMGLDVQMSEYNDFDRRPEAGTFESCFEAIRQCDYFLLLVGRCRGSWYSEEDQISVTQQEFRVAIECARQGHIKPLAFVRRDVLRTVEAQAHGPSQAFPDLEFIRSFIDEIKNTSVDAVSRTSPSGTVWLYSFERFDEIVQALRVGMNLDRSLHRQVLLANLEWELVANIAYLCEKGRGGSLMPITSWLTTVRKRVQLLSAEVGRTIVLDEEEGKRVGIFWMSLPLADRIRSWAVAEAISSRQFHTYDQASGRLVETAESRVMRALLTVIEQIRHLLSAVRDRIGQLDRMFQLFRGPMSTPTIHQFDLVLLFSLNDAFLNLLSLSRSLHHYIVDPGYDLKMPSLRPTTPYEDQVESITEERVSHADVERWLQVE